MRSPRPAASRRAIWRRGGDGSDTNRTAQPVTTSGLSVAPSANGTARQAPPDAARRADIPPRPAWPPLAHGLALLISLLSAIALLALGLSLQPAPLPTARAADDGTTEAAVVARFYAGLNQALAQDDPAALDAVLASDVVVQVPGQPAGDRAALLAWLADLRHAAPGTRVTLNDVLVGRDRAAARATASGGQPQIAGAAVLGVPADWDASAFLQLRDGRVIAYAPIAVSAALAAALPDWRLSLAKQPQSLQLARLQLPTSRSQAEEHLLQGQLLLAEAGTIQVEVAGPVQRAVLGLEGGRWQDVPRSARPLALRPGEALLIPPDAPLTLWPADAGPATLLQLGALPLAPEAARRPGTSHSAASVFANANGFLQLADGASLAPLAEGLGPGGAVVTVTRAELPPGAALAPHPVAGVQLLAVEAGLLGVAVAAIAPDAPDPTGGVLIQDGFPLGPGTAPLLRNAGGTRLDLIVVTIDPLTPAGAGGTASPVAPTGGWLPNWTASRVATATAAGQICSASACH